MKKLILATALFLVSCGTDKSDSDSDGADSTSLIGDWWIEDGSDCAISLQIEEDRYLMLYLCVISSTHAEMSYKIYDRDDNLSGTVIESTCDDVGLKVDYFGKVSNNKLSVSTEKGLVTGMNRLPESEDSSLTYSYGCYQSGTFEPTKIYK